MSGTPQYIPKGQIALNQLQQGFQDAENPKSTTHITTAPADNAGEYRGARQSTEPKPDCEDPISRLIEMGFTRTKAAAALLASGGSVRAALAQLEEASMTSLPNPSPQQENVPPVTTTSTTSSSPYVEKDIQTLCDCGNIPRNKAIALLDVTKGNLREAVALLCF
eukprot:PhF_6_TR31258/c0_g1_i1/m.45804